MNLGFSEMLFLFFLALIIFGPKRLPEIGRQIGKALAEFRRASNEFKLQLETEMRQIEVEQAVQKQKERENQAQLSAPLGTASSGSVKREPDSAVVTPAPAVEVDLKAEPNEVKS
ncbi:MAG: Sec-independent protein translocase protein TatB [Terriglobales bacterium]|jgi:sec-independent protein translocase protein TatB